MLTHVVQHMLYTTHTHVCIHVCIQLPRAICIYVISALSQGGEAIHSLWHTCADWPHCTSAILYFLLPLGHNICLTTHPWVQPLSGIFYAYVFYACACLHHTCLGEHIPHRTPTCFPRHASLQSYIPDRAPRHMHLHSYYTPRGS